MAKGRIYKSMIKGLAEGWLAEGVGGGRGGWVVGVGGGGDGGGGRGDGALVEVVEVEEKGLFESIGDQTGPLASVRHPLTRLPPRPLP